MGFHTIVPTTYGVFVAIVTEHPGPIAVLVIGLFVALWDRYVWPIPFVRRRAERRAARAAVAKMMADFEREDRANLNAVVSLSSRRAGGKGAA